MRKIEKKELQITIIYENEMEKELR